MSASTPTVAPCMDAYDIAIVGAGPAGAVSAWLLAQSRPNLRIVLCDAETEPRHRPCGEYLAPGGLGVLDRAGLLDAVVATGAFRLDAVALCGPSGGPAIPFKPVLGLHPPVDHGLGVRRERFDKVLQDHAGSVCELRRNCRIRSVDRLPTGWQLIDHQGRQLATKLLVGADGRNSIVRRACGLDRRPSRQRFALVTRATGVDHGTTVEMHLGPLGQIGLCPLGGGEVNLNLLLAPEARRLLRGLTPERLLRAALAVTPALAGRTRQARLGRVMATGSLPQGCRTVAADGAALVGDASGFCDPFTGEGMSLALRSAELFATAVAADRGLSGYAADFQQSIGRRRAIGEALQGLLSRRRLSEGVAGALARLPLLGRLLVADAAGYQRGYA